MSNTRGKFIVFEGLDRSGKSTMTKMVAEKLSKNSQTVTYGFPNRSSKIGQMINDFLSNKVQIPNQAVHLLFSANRWECLKQIQQNLKAGNNVVCDRYWYSGVAYSCAKGMNLDWCMASDQGLLEPNLVLFLKGNPQILAKRSGYGQQRFQRVEFQQKVHDGFNKLFQKLNKDYVRIVEIDQKNLEQVGVAVNKVIQQYLSNHR